MSEACPCAFRVDTVAIISPLKKQSHLWDMMFDQLSWAAGLASVIEHEAPVRFQSASLFIADEQNPTSRSPMGKWAAGAACRYGSAAI
jgi:hypothetical protein